ncbi:MAG: EAL domain-containing protein [Deltaproteobacteria bacterium]|nr:EAL domain-containing protein [Deltaproteobacteria bacterium]
MHGKGSDESGVSFGACNRHPGDCLSRYKTLFSNLSDLAYVCDADGKIIYINKASVKFAGSEPAVLIGTGFVTLVEGRTVADAEAAFRETLQGNCPRAEFLFSKTGVLCESRNMPLMDGDGAITGVVGIGRDINDLERAEEAIKSERDRNQRYLDLANVIFVVIGADRKVELINRKGRELLGYSEDEIIGRDWFDFIPERLKEGAAECFKKVASGETPPPECFEGIVVRRDGGERVIAWHNALLADDDGRVVAVLSSGDDITELKRAEEELKQYWDGLEGIVGSRTAELEEANERLKEEIGTRKKAEQDLLKLTKAIEQSANLVCITDVNGVIEYVNPTFEKTTGWKKEEALGQNPRVIASGTTPKETYDELWATILSGNVWKGTFRNKRKDGEPFWVSAVISPIFGEEGRITHFLAVHEDITEQKVSREQIKFLSHYDGLTGLINRSRFIELLTSWICTSRDGSSGALFLLDIDQFKFISDAYGHGMGDEFLRKVARLLTVTLRYATSRLFGDPAKESFLCRLSGDEFAVFLPNTCREDAGKVAEHLRAGLESFYQSDVPCHLTVSVGVSLYPDHGSTASELLTKADAAMYRAKELGRNRTHLYTPEELEIEQMHFRLKWKEDIIAAVMEDRFEPWYQPILHLGDGTVRKFEVLARMRDRDGKIILPGPFIDIAERFGIVSSISKVIFEKAMILQAENISKGRPLSFCLNLSGKELGDRDLLNFLKTKMAETGADPSLFVFEITETSSIPDLDAALSFIKELKSLGCRISLDDFGIGFTSFQYLKELHVDYIKIAGSFIKGLDKNLNDRLFVKAITDVARGMSIQTIAEFVETDGIMDILRSIGVDYAQGYHVGKPAPFLSP